ncbi:TetR/AcrR family transcriptional regulator [Microbacterium sp. Sa4CUA7]|uniref:TetR/AcrR family transcriptional regulator n=1 Tax=Microbacterium pullorum TaxID=2762236 RepID=A0ABR8S3R5_9MICO|nr:TetR/AcrR family transcriptional regulator [Microbacterium pullorum]MBD7958116.1 TetR/AcrR family transcriptional regulator [Microbacterium pullorum]
MHETSRTRLSPDARRQQILDAAGQLYRGRRYDDVSMEELAAAAGVARGLLHHYFGSKRDLFLAVMTQSVRLPLDELPDLDGRPVEQRARLTMTWILDGARTYGQSWVNAAGAEGLQDGGDVQAVVDRADDRAARFVLDALGLPDDEALRARLRPTAAFVKALCREWMQRETLTRDDVLELSTAAVLRAVRVD